MSVTYYYIIGGVIFLLILIRTGILGVTVNTKNKSLNTFTKSDPKAPCNCGKEKPKPKND